MSGIVERVARAIYEGRNGSGRVPWSRRVAAHKAPYLLDARASVAAMREPAAGMVEAGSCVIDSTSFAYEASAAWRAMIDAALEGKL